MTLLEAIGSFKSLDQESTIYAVKPWTPSSEVVLELEPEEGELPPGTIPAGFDYFLEVFIVEEFLDGWASNWPSEPSLYEKCERLIQYAIYDA